MAVGEGGAERERCRHAAVADIAVVGVAIVRVVVAEAAGRVTQVAVVERAAEPVEAVPIDAVSAKANGLVPGLASGGLAADAVAEAVPIGAEAPPGDNLVAAIPVLDAGAPMGGRVPRDGQRSTVGVLLGQGCRGPSAR